MPAHVAYHLTFLAPVALGDDCRRAALGLNVLRSDTLAGALWAQRALRDGAAPSDDGVRLSSAFPRVGDCRFFPRPCGTPAPSDAHRAPWWSEAVLADFAAGRTTPACRYALGPGWVLAARTDEALPADAALCPLRQATAGLDRAGGRATPRVVEALVWRAAGLWFLARFPDAPGARARFEAALEALGDAGVGAHRRLGYGRFCCTAQPWTDAAFPPARRFLSLSVYRPTPDEWAAGVGRDGCYRLERRQAIAGAGGSGGYRTRAVRALAEGAYLSYPRAGAVAGTCPVVLAPSVAAPWLAHPVVRPLWAFDLPLAAPGARP